jgi:hypothetical protein
MWLKSRVLTEPRAVAIDDLEKVVGVKDLIAELV